MSRLFRGKGAKEIYEGGWTCPDCRKYHSKPHWKDDRQLAGQEKWSNWEGKADACLPSNPKYRYENGVPRGLFCPHCGWEEERVILMKVPA